MDKDIIRIEADMDYLDVALEMIRSKLQVIKPIESEAMNVEVAAEEIITNIISYAYVDVHERTDKYVEIECSIDTAISQICVIFRDSGIPYNPLEKPDPDLEIDIMERPIGGLGIYMTKKFMDRVSYEYVNGQNVLCIEKIFKGK